MVQTLEPFVYVNAKRSDPPQQTPVDPVLRATLAKNLRAARQAADMTQKDLGKLCNLSDRYIGLIERQLANVSLDVLALLAVHLNTTPIQLLTSHDHLSGCPGAQRAGRDGSDSLWL